MVVLLHDMVEVLQPDEELDVPELNLDVPRADHGGVTGEVLGRDL